MIRFLLKGLFRDQSRSRLPVIVVSTGVLLTVLMHAYINGFMGDVIETNARFQTGHLKVMTKAYSENIDQVPNDLAITGSDKVIEELNNKFPDIEWTPRIHFGGLLDTPDSTGETRTQGPAIGIGIDLLSPGSEELKRFNLAKSLVRGKLPLKKGEAILSEKFSVKLKVSPGDKVTLISSTMDGSMSFYNFIVAGTVFFGQEALDRGTIIADIGDIRTALNMEGTAGEIVGFFGDGFYDDKMALKLTSVFNKSYERQNDNYKPVMKSLSQQGTMGTYVNLVKSWSLYISMIFILAMSLVLWNAGLLGGLRRYGEFGIRLAMGEEKSHVYRTMLYESVMIGIAGSVTGSLFGLFFSWLLQKYGIDVAGMMEGSSVLIPSVIRAKITPVDFYLGFIPGVISTVIGTALSGIGIYKRQTARLFKELEA
jgi:putative ABC transport system permease protein